MAIAGYANLYHGGGGGPQYPKRREDIFNPEKKGEPRMSGFGSKPTYNFIPNLDCAMYPQPDIGKTDQSPMSLECVKGGGTFAMSRNLNVQDPRPGRSRFRMNDDTNNTAMWEWFLKNQDAIVPDYCLNLVVIPMCIESDMIYLRTCNVMEGLTFDIVEFFTETPIAEGVDLGAPVQAAVDECRTWCARYPIPEGLDWSADCNRIFGIKLLTVPPAVTDICKDRGCGLLDGLNLDFSVRAFCPWAGD